MSKTVADLEDFIAFAISSGLKLELYSSWILRLSASHDPASSSRNGFWMDK